MTQKAFGNETRQMRRNRERGEEKTSPSLSGLMTDESVKEFIILYNDEEYVFEYKNAPWGTTLKHAEACYSQNGSFDMARYYENMLLDTIITFPGGQKPTRSVLQKFEPDVFFQLAALVPKPSFGENVEETKKELNPSLEEMEEDTNLNDSSE